MPAASLATCQVLAWLLLATSSVWLETSMPIKTESDTSSHSHPCLCELQVPTTVRAAEKDGPARAPSAQARASNIPEAARATRAGPRLKDTRSEPAGDRRARHRRWRSGRG